MAWCSSFPLGKVPWRRRQGQPRRPPDRAAPCHQPLFKLFSDRMEGDEALLEERVMDARCAVDAELFDSLEEAIAFVAAHGGGIVYSETAATSKGLTLPDNVRLEQRRPAG
jgi:hypothetical protein